MALVKALARLSTHPQEAIRAQALVILQRCPTHAPAPPLPPAFPALTLMRRRSPSSSGSCHPCSPDFPALAAHYPWSAALPSLCFDTGTCAYATRGSQLVDLNKHVAFQGRHCSGQRRWRRPAIQRARRHARPQAAIYPIPYALPCAALHDPRAAAPQDGGWQRGAGPGRRPLERRAGAGGRAAGGAAGRRAGRAQPPRRRHRAHAARGRAAAVQGAAAGAAPACMRAGHTRMLKQQCGV